MTPARSLLWTLAPCALALTLMPSVAEATPPIHSPWPCGEDESVSQGHNTTDTHGGTNAWDAWAWDLRRGEGDPVVAPYDGIVRAAKDDSEESCCATCGCWRNTNHVVIAYDDGTEAQLMHLKKGTVPFEVGDLVRRGDVVGQVGLTGQITGAHLHFAVQEEPCVGDAPWYCESIAARFVDTGDPLASNRSSPVNYASRNCTLDASCIVGPEAALTIDDSSSCFIDADGTVEWARYDEPSDSYSYRYVPNAAGTESTGAGYWRFRVEQAGLYRVEVQMPWWNEEVPNGSASVTYEVGSGAVVSQAGPVSQIGSSAEWVVLGEGFVLRPETESYVRLGNATPEATGTTVVGFDQVRITRVGEYVPPSCAVIGGTEIEESSECFTPSGENWFEEAGGRDGYVYSNSNDLLTPLEVGTWELRVASTEEHQLWIHAPEGAETANARYRLFNGYITLDLDPVDQSQGPGWILLTHGGDDRFDLYAGLPARLSLGDATGEPFVQGGDNTVVAYDSIAVAPASLGFDPTSLGEKADGFGDGGVARGGDESGCACRARAHGGPGGALLVLLGLWGLRRRRATAG